MPHCAVILGKIQYLCSNLYNEYVSHGHCEVLVFECVLCLLCNVLHLVLICSFNIIYGRGNQTPRRCFNCCRVGHLQRDCPGQPCRPQSAEHMLNMWPTGHVAIDCPQSCKPHIFARLRLPKGKRAHHVTVWHAVCNKNKGPI